MKQTDTHPASNSENSLEERIRLKIDSIAALADDLPAVVIIHNFQKGMSVEYISPRGVRELGFTVEQIREMGEEYHSKFFNQEDIPEQIAKMTDLLQKNSDEEIASLFQQVRASENHPWAWHLTTIKILMRDDEGKVLLTIALAFPIDPLHHVTAKVARLLDENIFLRKNYSRFSKLSAREKEILKYIALGKSAAECAEELFISVTTVETHRRNLKKKLGTSSSFEISQYARAFDLI
ncbi:response regulator transcription factor [Pontibacter fetidus]|uniref:LuxR family transcriptional regulator n=1 Tax=Pontibacter fetidus TaxID=2700082 RepID=A0A6B2H653_9BACT|nr:LuxR C-terminal-related transcriptional regulator [Pontibacter fetidus]NDK55807.1 LuxR family transcriptional regulator [Pontibacter fetidus]